MSVTFRLFGFFVDKIFQKLVSFVKRGMLDCSQCFLSYKKLLLVYLWRLVSFLLQYQWHLRLPIALHQESPYFYFEKRSFLATNQAFFYLQRTAAPARPWSSFDLSAHITRPVQYFLASSSAFFFGCITISPLNLPDSIISTSSTPSAGSIECSIVVCQANQWLYKVGRAFSVYIKVCFGSSPSWKPPSPFLRLIGKISLAECWSGRISSRQAYYLWQ